MDGNQIITVKYLLSIPGVKAAADDIVNHRGLKALQLLEHFSGTDFVSDSIRHIFKDSGLTIVQEDVNVVHKKSAAKTPKRKGRNWLGFLKYKGDWMEDKRGSIMIVSTVISTITFQSAINPPGGVWQQNTKDRDKDGIFDCSEANVCLAGTSVLARANLKYYSYTNFMFYNSISFFASVSIILLLISGVPLKNKFFMFLLTLSMCVALAFLSSTFYRGLHMVTPTNIQDPMRRILSASGIEWDGLIFVIILFHVVRFFYWIVKKLWRLFKRKQKTTDRK